MRIGYMSHKDHRYRQTKINKTIDTDEQNAVEKEKERIGPNVLSTPNKEGLLHSARSSGVSS